MALYLVPNRSTESSNITDYGNTSLFVDYSVCGAADCQNANVTQQNLAQYVPSRASLYLMTAILLSFSIIAILIFAFILPNVSLSFEEEPVVSVTNGQSNQVFEPEFDVVQTIESNNKEKPNLKEHSRMESPDAEGTNEVFGSCVA